MTGFSGFLSSLWVYLSVITCLKVTARVRVCASELKGGGQVFLPQTCVHWAQMPAQEQVHVCAGGAACRSDHMSAYMTFHVCKSVCTR